MRYILPFSILFISCASLFKKQEFSGNLTIVLSYNGNGIFAVQPDTIAKGLKVSVISRGEERDFKFYSKVFLGSYGEGSFGQIVMDSLPIAVYNAEFKTSDSVGIRIFNEFESLKFPKDVKLVSPKDSIFSDWENIELVWEGNAKQYILRIYAFTLMDQIDQLKFVNDNNFKVELSGLYGDGFFAIQICPVNSLSGKRNLKIFALGKCLEKVFLVGDASVWGGEKPSPPWKKDEVMWYLLAY